MALKLYQIENIPLHLHSTELFDHYSTKTDASARDLLYSHRKVPIDNRWIFNTTTIKTNGYLISNAGFNANALVQRLRSVQGMPTNIIAYEILSDSPQIDKCLCACYPQCKGCDILWLQTFGTLKTVTSRQEDAFSPIILELEFDIYDFWRNLNTFLWKWGSGVNIAPLGKHSLDGVETVSEFKNLIGHCPTCDMLFACDDCVHPFRRIDYEGCSDLVYSPVFWEAFNCQCNDCAHGSARGYETVNRWYNINVDKDKWGAPPLSVYSLTNLPDTGTVYIQVFHEDNMISCLDETTFDIDTANQMLSELSYDPISSSDVLWFGEIREYYNGKLYSPAFLKRGGDILIDFHPLIEYTTFFPGMLFPGLNRIFIDIPNSNRDAEVAFWHQFRRI